VQKYFDKLLKYRFDSLMQNYSEKLAKYYSEHGLYDERDEHDSCGVGLIAAIDGQMRREVVDKAIYALKSLWHRGAVNADGKTGDGAGIHLQLPHKFFANNSTAYQAALQAGAELAVGVIFLPRTDANAQESAKLIIETELNRLNMRIIGWRQVPIRPEIIGDDANLTRPEIMQVLIKRISASDKLDFEQELYVVRRRIEQHLRNSAINDCYICSFSSRTIIYKGLFQASHLSDFYPELSDNRISSSYALFHQRFSTNTLPSWAMAQPFRMIAHNGEINTLRGNVNWMSSYETCFGAEAFEAVIDDLTPIVPPSGSDTAMLDSVAEFVTLSGKALPFSKLMLIPPAWRADDATIAQNHRDFYGYLNCLMSPWDGPAAIVACDGKWVIAGTDRNGLRPLRYAITRDGLLTVGSETGMAGLMVDDIIKLGQLSPGQLIGVNLEDGKYYDDLMLKDYLANQADYAEKLQVIKTIPTLSPQINNPLFPDLIERQIAIGLSAEDIDMVILPMLREGKEAVGSMGDDTPLAVLSSHYRGLHHFFRQHFSQVTNPPIDPLRETHAMSLATKVGGAYDILGDNPDLSGLLHLNSPILMQREMKQITEHFARKVAVLDCTYQASNKENALRNAVDELLIKADVAINQGAQILVLCDMNVCENRLAIPSILAAGTVHTHMVRLNKRKQLSIVARAADVVDTHSMAVLIGVGATVVYPYLMEMTAVDLYNKAKIKLNETKTQALTNGEGQGDDFSTCINNLRHAYEQGLLKIMSKMGISVVSSYRGGRNFDAIGLSRSLVAEFFPGLVSRISGIGLPQLHHKIHELHKVAYQDNNISINSTLAGESNREYDLVGGEIKQAATAGSDKNYTPPLTPPAGGGGLKPQEVSPKLPVGGFYRYRGDGERHAYEADLIHRLQTACATGSLKQYMDFANKINASEAIHIRSLFEFCSDKPPIALQEVESVQNIRARFVAPAMSLGSLSPEAHQTLSIAMNRIGAASNSGEGGEGAERFQPLPNGDNPNSSIKQVASGRFGVTAEYLQACDEIQIKVAQGAKPGEGGQLPAFKVTAEIARLRHTTKGTTLISPPPHHDIYSIEDLAQLIYDLKQINPNAIVSVKLVAQSGIGTIASGVVKAMADKIIISGHVGGTGASPLTSIKYAGVPWEMGLAEVSQVLAINKLRHRVRLQTDGGLKVGRDIVIAAMLGADEYAIGTLSLVAMGCLMVRQCHSNTCPVGICTQDEKLRKHFDGTPEKVINLMSFIAEDVRHILASLGYRSLNEIIGRTDLLRQIAHHNDNINMLDLTPLLTRPTLRDKMQATNQRIYNPVPDALDAKILQEAGDNLRAGRKLQLNYTVHNTDRTIGTRLSHFLLKQFAGREIDADLVKLSLQGTAGQSLGAFLIKGITIDLVGDANDYVGKGLSGGKIIVRPTTHLEAVSNDNAIIGNTVLYGATSGELYAAGRAGERFAVRNSGATAVIEGAGSNALEYMTGGVVVILGKTGNNIAAGMTGGIAFIYDEIGILPQLINKETVKYEIINHENHVTQLKSLIEAHIHHTNSLHAKNILEKWEEELQHFFVVQPK
jgi:glutamate synthase (NADPH) large chain